MSRSITDHQRKPTTVIANQLRQARQVQSQQRTLQLQGNEALSLYVNDGFFTMGIPTTPTTYASTFYVSTPTASTIMLANLAYSVYYTIPDGGSSSGYVWDQRDAGNLYPLRLDFECFLSYDDRLDVGGNPALLPALANQAAVLATGVPDNAIRLTCRIRSNATWSLPVGASNYCWVYYQVRATLM